MEYYSQIVSTPTLDKEVDRLKEIEIKIENINKERVKQKTFFDRKDELLKEEAVLRFQLEEFKKEKSDKNIQKLKELNLKRDILEFALNALETKRIKINKDILSKLEKITELNMGVGGKNKKYNE